MMANEFPHCRPPDGAEGIGEDAGDAHLGDGGGQGAPGGAGGGGPAAPRGRQPAAQARHRPGRPYFARRRLTFF